MKKSILILLFVIPFLSFSQKKQRDTAKVKLPIIQGAIVYEQILDSLGKSKGEIYDASLKYLANTFVDSKEVIQIKNPETANIVGSGNFVYTTPGFLGGNERMSFMLDITAKDNKARIRLYRFRYTIIDGNYRASSSDYQPSSLDNRYQQYLDQKIYPAADKKIFVLIDEKIKNIISSYANYIKGSIKDDF